MPDEHEGVEKIVERIVYKPTRKRLPDERPALTHKFNLAGHEGYLHVGLYPDSKMPGEIFIRMAKEGSTISGLMDAFATSISIALQYGVPLADLCAKFSHMRFEPSGFTNNRTIPLATSIMDYIFRYLSLKFLDEPPLPKQNEDDDNFPSVVAKSGPAVDQEQMSIPFGEHTISTKSAFTPKMHATAVAVSGDGTFRNQEDAPLCSTCGAITVRSGACYTCTQCGSSSGCG